MGDWLGLPAAFIAWALALYIYLVAARNRTTWLLIGLLIADGFAVSTSYYNSLYYNPILVSLGLPAIENVRVWHQASDWALMSFYVAFIGAILKSPLVSWLRRPVVGNTILCIGLAFSASIFWLPEWFLELVAIPFYVAICVILSWGVIAAFNSWQLAESSSERARAKAFTIAFGLRDIIWIFTFAVFAYYQLGDGLDALNESPAGVLLKWLYQGAIIFYIPLLAYGILRTQLFDIDLRIKTGLKNGTAAAIFFTIFFVISELASNLLSDQFGTIFGVLAAGVLVFFLDPIFRVGELLSNTAMPNTVATPEYENFRKLQVYDAAVRTALENGNINERERKLLDSLVNSLGIDTVVAQQIEADLNTSH